ARRDWLPRASQPAQAGPRPFAQALPGADAGRLPAPGERRAEQPRAPARHAQTALGEPGEVDEYTVRETLQIGARRIAIVGGLSRTPERNVERAIVSRRNQGRRRLRRLIGHGRVGDRRTLDEIERARHVA